jgi:hypothetical protein
MSARDDSPVIANRYNITSTDEYRRALDEIDRLRAEVARLTPVVEAAKRWRAASRRRSSHACSEDGLGG